jgi:hypothetical protein
VEEASNSQIVGAARITAQTQNGWTIGALGARTAAIDATVADSTGGTNSLRVEPAASYAIARAARRSSSGDAAFGIIGTIVERGLGSSSHDSLAAILPSTAATAGADADYWWSNHTYHITATGALSTVAGDSAALQRIQASSVH